MPAPKRTATGVLGGVLGLVGLSAVAGLLVTAAVTPAIAVAGATATSAISMFEKFPDYLQIGEPMLPSEIYATDSNGNDILLAQFYDQNREPKEYGEIAPVVYEALISSEDQDFYTHRGVDLLGTVGAVVSNFQGNDTRGGSTITQQYVKNVIQQECEKAAANQDEVTECFFQTTASEGVEGNQRKLQEMRYAIALEQRYSKNDIVLGYLNTVHFGGETYGIGAAAQYYFGVDASNLSLTQAATLVGMVQEPNAYRIDRPAGSITLNDGSVVNSEEDGYSRTLERRNYVLYRLLADGKITQAQYDAAREETITPAIHDEPRGCGQAGGSAFFCEYVMYTVLNNEAFGDSRDVRDANLRRGGLKIYTTLDLDLQMPAEEAMSIVPADFDGFDLGSAAVQTEVKTGRVLSMVQNRPFQPGVAADDRSGTEINFNTTNPYGGSDGFPAGSTYKLFSLVNWLEQGHSVNETINGRVGTKRVINCDPEAPPQVVPADNSGRPGAVGNFQADPGYSGSPMRFTADSLNSGFFAMAERISVCSTNQLAGRMGVTWGDGVTPLDEVPPWSNNSPNQAYDVLGSSSVAPVQMAAAYATIANKGVYCEPKVIDRVTNWVGEELAIPETSCERVISEGVAATSAFALEGVMNGTGVDARTFDGVPIFGKTGIHEYEHTWMDGASTEVATAVWVGNVAPSLGDPEHPHNAKINEYTVNGWQVSRIRNAIWPVMQRAANAKYGGEAFPAPDPNLTRRVLTNLPNVVGMSTEEARRTLEAAGFSVTVGEPVDGSRAPGTIQTQNPGAGQVPAGTPVTISPSNGQGVSVPSDLVGRTPADAASAIRSAGFGDPQLVCEETDGAPDEGRVTAVSPDPGSESSRDAQVTVTYESDSCS